MIISEVSRGIVSSLLHVGNGFTIISRKLARFHASSSVTSVAPLASVACAKVGTRVTSIVGAVLVSGGFLMSIFADSVTFLYISMGVIVGE